MTEILTADLKLAPFPIDSCAPAHLKLVRFPARSPLPIAALPSMSLFPKAPFDLSVWAIYVARIPAAPFARSPRRPLPSISLIPSARFTDDTDAQRMTRLRPAVAGLWRGRRNPDDG